MQNVFKIFVVGCVFLFGVMQSIYADSIDNFYKNLYNNWYKGPIRIEEVRLSSQLNDALDEYFTEAVDYFYYSDTLPILISYAVVIEGNVYGFNYSLHINDSLALYVLAISPLYEALLDSKIEYCSQYQGHKVYVKRNVQMEAYLGDSLVVFYHKISPPLWIEWDVKYDDFVSALHHQCDEDTWLFVYRMNKFVAIQKGGCK